MNDPRSTDSRPASPIAPSRRQVLRAAALAAAAGAGAAAGQGRARLATHERTPTAGGTGQLQIVWDGPGHSGTWALTFDDGPSVTYTPRLLDDLAAAGARATFFLVGQAARQHPHLVSRIVEAGHEVANHSMTHADLGLASPEQIHAEIADTHALLADLTGRAPLLFRPPYGKITGTVLAEASKLDYQLVMWSFALREQDRSSADNVAMVRERAAPGTIVLAHDAGDQRRRIGMRAVPGILAAAEQLGLQAVTVSELLAG